MTNRFEKGDDVLEDDADFITYGITDTKSPQRTHDCAAWINRIEIHSTDAKLRDTILGLLNGEVVKT